MPFLKKSVVLACAIAAGLVVMLLTPPAGAADGRGNFADDDGNVHESNIEAIATAGVTRGCNPPANHRFCPRDTVTRGQMAAFLARTLGLPAPTDDWFDDSIGHVFANDINALYEAGITRGCDPPANDRFCPDDAVTRGQMAAFLRRAFGLPLASGDHFDDDTAHVFEADINAIAEAGITIGCNPPANDRFCPDDEVRRDQMASFLVRAIPLEPIRPGVPANPGDAVNCSSFDTHDEAQEWFDFYEPHYGDVARLDGNNDGVVCASLPGAP